MDAMTIFGILGAISLITLGIAEGGAVSAFMNLHGILLVIGGTLCSTMVNSSFKEIKDTFKAGFFLFRKPHYIQAEQIIPIVSALATKSRQQGIFSLQDEGKDIGDDGFFAHAIDVCLTTNDELLARVTLEKEINQVRVRHREVGNIFRTAGLLSPMFGLLGTLIGIIGVLRNISDPEKVGPEMAVAISSAFYGILIANLVCVPGAGKLRTRSMEELLSKEMMVEGLCDVIFSSRIPIIIEMRLLSYLQTGKMSEEGGGTAVPAPAKA